MPETTEVKSPRNAGALPPYRRHASQRRSCNGAQQPKLCHRMPRRVGTRGHRNGRVLGKWETLATPPETDYTIGWPADTHQRRACYYTRRKIHPSRFTRQGITPVKIHGETSSVKFVVLQDCARNDRTVMVFFCEYGAVIDLEENRFALRTPIPPPEKPHIT